MVKKAPLKEITVLHALYTIKDAEMRNYVLANLDTRYLNDKVYTLAYALTFGVDVGAYEFKTIKEYMDAHLRSTGNETPNHKHDCDNCYYLGDFNGDDLYFHPGQMPTLIARYGESGDYLSGLQFGEQEKNDMTSPLGEAYRRAKHIGLL